MREMHIAMCLIEQDGFYLLQRRLGDPKIGAAGLIGCFGGKIEANESADHAICRELSEETNLRVNESDIVEIGKVSVVSDNNHEPVSVFATVFHTTLDSEMVVEEKEGILVRVPKNKLKFYIKDMTPATKACFEQLV